MDEALEPLALRPGMRDQAWKHCGYFKDGDRGNIRCNYCMKMFKNGGDISFFKRHLAGLGGKGTICDKVPEAVRLLFKNSIDEFRKRHSSISERSNHKIHMAIGRFLFSTGHDFDAVNSVYLQPLIDDIASGFRVSAPTQDDLLGWILKSCVKEITKEIDECKTIWKSTGCSVLVEECNFGKDIKVLKFLVYSSEKVFFLRSMDASEILPFPDKLFNLLKELVEEIGVANVVQVITKCDDHYAIAGKRLMLLYPSLYWVPCAADCIDKILEQFGKLDWISNTIKQAQAITRFIYNHSDVLKLMWKFTFGNDILQPRFTTSATSFATLCRISELRSNLQAMVTSPECCYSKEPLNVITDEDFWKKLDLIKHLTDPLLRVLKIVCSEKRPAMGYVYAALYKAKEKIKTHPVHKEDYRSYWRIIDQWWDKQKDNHLIAAGFFLNPRFLYKASKDIRDEIVPDLQKCIEIFVPDNKIQDEIFNESYWYINGVGVNELKLPNKARDPKLPGFLAKWWSTYGVLRCLNLSRFAIRILSQTCSSLVGCRRNQILVEQIYKSKNSIEQKQLSELVFVQYNMRLRQMGEEREDETVDPFSYNNMDVLKDWVLEDQCNVGGNGRSDWMSVESIKRTQVVPNVDEIDDLCSDFNDIEIVKKESKK